MSSLFINLISKTSQYLHMKVLNERIPKWAHLSFYDKQFLRYLHLKFKKEMIFLGRLFSQSGYKIWPGPKLGNLGNLGILFPRFRDFRGFRVFDFPFFHFSTKIFFNILKSAILYFISMSCIVFKAF